MAGVSGALKHLRIAKETTWGTFPATPTYYYIPIVGDGYTVRQRNEFHDPETSIFNYRRGPFTLVRKDVSGDLTVMAQPGYVRQILDWGLERSATFETSSFSAEFRDGVTAFRHTGLKCETLTISGDADSGDLTFALALVGKDESVITPFAVPSVTGDATTGYVDEDFFIFQHGNALEIPDGTRIATISAFTFTITNNHTVGPAGSDNTIVHLTANRQTVNGTVTLLYEDDTFGAILRNFSTTSLDFNFTHPGGTVIRLTIPRVILTDLPREGGQSDTLTQTLNFEAEYDSTAADQITYSVT